MPFLTIIDVSFNQICNLEYVYKLAKLSGLQYFMLFGNPLNNILYLSQLFPKL
jgi:Leucine-rich repeat (LRR) protein